MPWTFAHPAAILPFRRFCPKYLSLDGLIIGAISPDIGYYVGYLSLLNKAHTPIGVVFICMPASLLIIICIRLLHKHAAELLPSPHRQAIRSLRPIAITESISDFFRLIVAIAIGAVTHIIWDSFTHATGYAVALISGLQAPVFTLAGKTIYLYKILQYVSTVFGIVVLVMTYQAWLSRVTSAQAYQDEQSDAQRYTILLVVFSVVLMAAVVLATFVTGPTSVLNNLSSFAIRVLVYGTSIIVVLFSITSLIYTFLHDDT